MNKTHIKLPKYLFYSMNNVVIVVFHILNSGCTSYILINEVYTVVFNA